MVKKQSIQDFENMKLGMFIHFGLYSQVGKGEWYMHNDNVDPKEYDKLIDTFYAKKDWAKEIVSTAKKYGFKYIVLTTRHHDGFSLYDTKGLTHYDAVHSPIKRDLVREFVDECNEQGIVPFFYATLIDWYNDLFKTDFDAYLTFLRESIKILCTNYGKIGGFWFDGTWSDKKINWCFDKLFGIIRKYQPDALIINNGGEEDRGEIIDKEIDVIEFERYKPFVVQSDDKYRAKEMCQTITRHWGYFKNDQYKTPQELADDYSFCKKNHANFLLNCGPLPDGTIDSRDIKILSEFSKIIKNN